MNITIENILKVVDINHAGLESEFLTWLRDDVDETYTDKAMKEHLYNPDDFDEMEVPTEFTEVIGVLQTICRENESGYFRIIK